MGRQKEGREGQGGFNRLFMSSAFVIEAKGLKESFSSSAVS